MGENASSDTRCFSHRNIAEPSGVDCSNLELLMLPNKDQSFRVSNTLFLRHEDGTIDPTKAIELGVILASVVAKLCRLKELLVGYSFHRWDVEDASIPDAGIMPKEDKFLRKLERYKIIIGSIDRSLFA
ncbi:hypothetical protein V6N13_015026 [Hibiscus sabdariffa]|uniref:Uncharacterized protein n=1 Tax=Hibiscus sabdariffa TaxID=183260 RepID=A0ABR2RX52_9ROSI